MSGNNLVEESHESGPRYKARYRGLSYNKIKEYYQEVGLRPGDGESPVSEPPVFGPRGLPPIPKRLRAERRGSQCTVCVHPDRAIIELAMARGLSKRAAGRQWPDLHSDAIYRHYRLHVPDHIKAAHKIEILKPSESVRSLSEAELQEEITALTQEESVGLLSHLQRIRAALYLAFDNAAQHNDVFALSRLSGQLHANLRLVAEKTGELERHSQQTINNLVVAPDYLNLRTKLIAALRPFPDAARAVAEVFREVEGAKAQTQTEAAIEYRPENGVLNGTVATSQGSRLGNGTGSQSRRPRGWRDDIEVEPIELDLDALGM